MMKYLIIGMIIGFIYRGAVSVINEHYRKYKRMERYCKSQGFNV